MEEDGSNVNAGRTGDVIPGDQEEMNKQDDRGGDAESNLFSRGWSKTGKRKEKSDRARVKIITGFFQEPGKQKLPVKKRKMSEDSPRGSSTTGDHRHSPSSGSRILEPGEIMENDGVVVTDYPGEEKTVASEILTEHVCNICNRSLQSYQASSGLKAHHDNDKTENVIFTDGSASRRSPPKTGLVYRCVVCNKIFSPEYCENQPRVALDFDLNELPPEWIPDE